MTTEKPTTLPSMDIPPAYVAPTASKPWSKRTVIASVYAAAVSAALVVVLIIGGLYVHEKRSMIQSSQIMEVDVSEPENQNNIHNIMEVDMEAQEVMVLIEYKNFGNLSTIGVLNHKTGVSGFYFPAERECMVGFGAQDALAEVFRQQKPNFPETMDDFWHRKQVEIRADRSQTAKLEDLPMKLRGLCEHHPIYLAEVTHYDGNGEGHTINKRALEADAGLSVSCCSCCCCCRCSCSRSRSLELSASFL